MLQLLGDLVPFAVPVAMSPLPIIALLMLLLAPGGVRGGLGFLAGRFAALAVLAVVFAWIAVGTEGSDRPEAGGWVRIAAGCLLIMAAVVLWWRRPRGGEAKVPGWMRSLEQATPLRAVGYGAALTAANVKELAFVIGAGMILGAASVPAAQAIALGLVFALLASLGVALPIAWVLVHGEGARAGLDAARGWLVRNNAIVAAAVLVLIGAMLVGSGIEGL